jgi:hypothetical protein
MLKTGTIIIALLWASAAAADMRSIPEDARFCPSWAEAHERTLASLNNGRAPYKGQWKGCIQLKKGDKVDLVNVEPADGSNEIIYKDGTGFRTAARFDTRRRLLT